FPAFFGCTKTQLEEGKMSTKTLSRILAAALLTVAGSQAATMTVNLVDQFTMERKVAMASSYFETVWAQIFAKRGARYSSPRIVSYTGTTSSACGVMHSNNAAYCPA